MNYKNDENTEVTIGNVDDEEQKAPTTTSQLLIEKLFSDEGIILIAVIGFFTGSIIGKLI